MAHSDVVGIGEDEFSDFHRGPLGGELHDNEGCEVGGEGLDQAARTSHGFRYEAAADGVVIHGEAEVIVEILKGGDRLDSDIDEDTLGGGAFLVGNADENVHGEAADENLVHERRS